MTPLDKHHDPVQVRKHWRYAFAASALEGLSQFLVSVPEMYSRPFNENEIVDQVVTIADMLLAELEKTE